MLLITVCILRLWPRALYPDSTQPFTKLVPPVRSNIWLGSVKVYDDQADWLTAATYRCSANRVESSSNIVTARLTYYITDRCP
jgi:hypothetical protein